MFQALYKYLILNSKAAIPGIGVFYLHRLPASLDFSKKTYLAPSTQIAFTEGTAESDNKFCLFLSKEQQIEEPEAIHQFKHFAEILKKDLKLNGRAELPGIGVLSKDVTGAVQFQQFTPLTSFYQDVAADRTIREASDEDMVTHTKDSQAGKMVSDAKSSSTKKDYWWVFALILAAVSIAAIIFYYYQNGSLR